MSVPDFDGAFNDANPTYGFGEVERVIVVDLDTDKDDVDFETSDNVIPVRGTFDEPEQTEIDTSLYRKAYPPARYTLTCAVDDISDTAYERLRAFHGGRCKMWFQAGAYLFGGDGIECDVKTHLTIDEGEEALQKYHIVFEWRSTDRLGPERENSPWEES